LESLRLCPSPQLPDPPQLNFRDSRKISTVKNPQKIIATLSLPKTSVTSRPIVLGIRLLFNRSDFADEYTRQNTLSKGIFLARPRISHQFCVPRALAKNPVFQQRRVRLADHGRCFYLVSVAERAVWRVSRLSLRESSGDLTRLSRSERRQRAFRNRNYLSRRTARIGKSRSRRKIESPFTKPAKIGS
jgi:hypothetical protein